jgi:hypothetical protein
MTETQTVHGRPVDAKVETELGQLSTAPIALLRPRYRELFKIDPPAAFGPDLLRRSIAGRIQEKAYGGLPRETQRLLNQMVRAMTQGGGNGRIELPRRIKPGSELVRTWKGQTYKVTVVVNGYSYGGTVFASLSEIANMITGTRWNGPKFFGLRPNRRDEDKAATKGSSRVG